MTLNLKNFDRTCLVILVMVTVICVYFAVTRTEKLKRQIHQENTLLSEKLRDLNLADTNLQQLKTMLETTTNDLASLNEQIPETSKMGEFLKNVDALMKAKGVVMINLGPLPEVKEKIYTKNPVHLVFQGPFVKIFEVIHGLENMTRKVVLEKLAITKSSLAGECRVDLMANIFKR